jgi:Ser/Thr protein kinase RdoA (MazF antagonist)
MTDPSTVRLRSPRDFTAGSAWQTLTAACEIAGLDIHGAQLLRLGTNANYRLAAHPVLVRISPGHTQAVRTEIAVARWLAGYGFPAARIAEDIGQPLAIDGRIVTFWQLIRHHRDPATVADIARLLYGLHELPEPAGFTLPVFDPLAHTAQRLASAGDGPDACFLRDRCEQLRDRYAKLRFTLPQGVIHGDAHEANALRDPSGTVVLIDFEACAWGPREWDLGVLAMRFRPFGWITEADYQACVAAYGGFDITSWDGYPVLTSIRELNMTSWLLGKAGQSQEHAVELHTRMADLRDDRAPRNWRAF